jgi:c-di-GMP-binding flagellar brake protein YcgR
MNNDDPVVFDKRGVVIEKLSILFEHKCVLTADLGKGESLFVMIADINLENSTLILRQVKDVPPILNGSTLEQLNKKMLIAPRVEFSTVFRDVQAAFIGSSIKKITYKGKHAFQMYIPSSLNWHNRRKYSRKKIPVAKSSFCEIVLPIPKSDATDEYKQNYATAIEKIKFNLSRKKNAINLICLELYDVSLAGCSLLNHDKEFSYFLTPNTIYEHCKIIMPDGSEINVSFEIMMKRTIESDESDEPDRVETLNELVGIRFLGITRDVIDAI